MVWLLDWVRRNGGGPPPKFTMSRDGALDRTEGEPRRGLLEQSHGMDFAFSAILAETDLRLFEILADSRRI